MILINDFNTDDYKTFVFEIFLTNKCQLSCPYCFVRGKRKNNKFISKDYNFNLKQLQTVLESLNSIKQYQNIKFLLMGGEPTLHPLFFDIIELIKSTIDSSRKISIVMMTNGITLLDENFYKNVELYSNILSIDLSLHFHNFKYELISLINEIKNPIKIRFMYNPEYFSVINDLLENNKLKIKNIVINQLFYEENKNKKNFFDYSSFDDTYVYNYNLKNEKIKTDIFYRMIPGDLFAKPSYLCIYHDGSFVIRNKFKNSSNYNVNIYTTPKKILESYLNKDLKKNITEKFFIQEHVINDFNFKYDMNDKKSITFFKLGVCM